MNKVLAIAMACHMANLAWCVSHGDNSQKPWDEAEQWQRDSAIKGVEFRLANPDAPASAQHDAWSKDKLADGWVYGEEKDAEKKRSKGKSHKKLSCDAAELQSNRRRAAGN